MRHERIIGLFCIAAVVAGILTWEVHARAGARDGPLAEHVGTRTDIVEVVGHASSVGVFVENTSGASLVIDRVVPVGLEGPLKVLGVSFGNLGLGADHGYPPAGHIVPAVGARLGPHGGGEFIVGLEPTAKGIERIQAFRIDYHSAHSTYRWVTHQAVVVYS